MRLIARIRVLFTLIVLASYSPLGVAIHRADIGGGYLGISLFTGRLTRSAATQQFEPTKTAVSRCPSRYVRRTMADVELAPCCTTKG
jgi:hypothetical protein